MTRTAQASAIVISIIAGVLGYLFYVPQADGVAQLNRVRAISAMMKTVKFIVRRSSVEVNDYRSELSCAEFLSDMLSNVFLVL